MSTSPAPGGSIQRPKPAVWRGSFRGGAPFCYVIPRVASCCMSCKSIILKLKSPPARTRARDWQIPQPRMNKQIRRTVADGMRRIPGGEFLMGSDRHDLGEVVVHRGGIGEGHDEAGGGAPLRANRAEDVGPLVASVARRPRARAALRPDPGERALLADPRLVLEPDFERPAACGLEDRRGYRLGEAFLKASCAFGSVFGCRGRTESRR